MPEKYNWTPSKLSNRSPSQSPPNNPLEHPSSNELVKLTTQLNASNPNLTIDLTLPLLLK
jgi:hypothetical protein